MSLGQQRAAWVNEAPNGALLQLYRWRWKDIQDRLDEIQKAGYSTIQLSPHTATCSGGNGNGYDPSDFTSFDSGFGTEKELSALIAAAHQRGIGVFADMVLNHMCGADFKYKFFGWQDFHHNGKIQNNDDPWWVENGDLLGLNDLCQECEYVRGQLHNYLVKSHALGFDGFRWDAAKHVPGWYWKQNVLPWIASWGNYSYGEVFHGNVDTLAGYAGLGMAVTDYALYFAMRDAFRFGGNLASLDGAGLAMREGGQALTFVENHDVPAPANRTLAYAFLSAYPGFPLYNAVRLDDAAINNLVWIHRNLAHGSVIVRAKSQNVLVFEREQHLLAGFNQGADPVQQWVQTSWKGVRLHDFSGKTADRWTRADGGVEVEIPTLDFVMLAPAEQKARSLYLTE